MNVKLLVVHGKPSGKSLIFGPGDYYLGRGPECHVRFNSDWVSRQHCLIRVTPEAVSLRDLSSRNGTLLNGALLHQEAGLKHGDLIQVGPIVFEIVFEELPGAISSGPPPTLSSGESDTKPGEPSPDSTMHLRSLDDLP